MQWTIDSSTSSSTFFLDKKEKVAGFETIVPPEDNPTCAVLSFISTPTF
jgi:hypothetical protein